MFPTFSGSSRKPRNVNLSGQKNLNPFAATPWTTGPPSGPSKTIADAQAERRQRQQERDRRDAARQIQRVWRGHTARQALRESRRVAFDQFYNPASGQASEQRLLSGLPLVLAIFTASRPDDLHRLDLVVHDLLATSFAPFSSGQIHPTRLNRLTKVLLVALDRCASEPASPRCETYIRTLDRILEIRPESVDGVLARYFECLGKYCCQRGLGGEFRDLLLRAVASPLQKAHPGGVGDPAYEEFARSFLIQQDILVFEQNVHLISTQIDILRLSAVLIKTLSGSSGDTVHKENQLWRLAHFIALQRANNQESSHPLYLRALSMQLSTLSDEIRAAFSTEDSGKTPRLALAPYVLGELSTLADKDGVSGLLEKFTSNHTGVSAADNENASLLAGYTLTLLRCFPGHGDDIRMRLYLADISAPSGRLPAVKYFWNAMSRTSIFSAVASNEGTALEMLRYGISQTTSSPLGKDTKWSQEWRTVLLFLELYVFLLRLTDDEDFFGGLSTSPTTSQSTSRLRLSGLTLENLRLLTTFLKHLGFSLYYNSAELLKPDSGNPSHVRSVDSFLDSSTTKQPAESSAQAQKSSVFNVIAGVEYSAFRSVVTTAMRMLYERDSRRPFLPQDHWLMTSKFDMQGFLSAVVLEEQRQHELRESGDDEDEGDEGDEEDEMELDGHATSIYAGQRQSRYAQMEKFRLQQKKAARERMLAAIGPKLEILRNMPFIIPFAIRVQIFRQFVHLDKERRRGGNIDPDRWRMWVLGQHGNPFDQNSRGRDILGRHHARIKRGQLFQDALNQFYDLGVSLKEPIQITFIDQFDTVEAGIDGGGVTKEFLTSVTKEAFTDDQSLFVANNKNAFYPNPCAVDQRIEWLRQAGIAEGSEEWRDSVADLLRQYEFLGRIIGKCIYEGILIDIVFAGFFLLKWSSSGADSPYRANINDLREMDDELYQGMLRLKNYPGDVADLSLDFTINDQVSLPDEPVRTVTRDLIPHRGDMPVNNENRPLYISYIARHRLLAQPSRQTHAFLRGLGTIIDTAWLSMFNQSELQRMVGGDSSEIDIEDLRANTVYSGVYAIGDDGEEHPTIRLFWDVMRALDDGARRDVLKYVTSTPRAPLLGFGQLSPQFSIRDGGQDQERLPSASTCVNLLKLPQYRTAAALKTKLLYAVTSGAGFDLS